MACFLVPAAQAIIVTAANAASEKHLKKEIKASDTDITADESSTLSFHGKVKWLRNMLWGGSAMLAFEHVWHGEVVPWFPFLTAAEDPASLSELLGEMATVGVTMAALVTAVWGAMLLGANAVEKRARKKKLELSEGEQ